MILEICTDFSGLVKIRLMASSSLLSFPFFVQTQRRRKASKVFLIIFSFVYFLEKFRWRKVHPVLENRGEQAVGRESALVCKITDFVLTIFRILFDFIYNIILNVCRSFCEISVLICFKLHIGKTCSRIFIIFQKFKCELGQIILQLIIG